MADGDRTPDDERDLPPGTHERWHIAGEGDAAWALTRLIDAEQRPARARAAAMEYVKRETKQAERDAEFFRMHLRDYYESNPPARGKTLHLPSGGFQRVDKGERLVVVDKEAAKQAHPDLVHREPQPDKESIYHEDLVKVWKKTKAPPDGCRVEKPEPEYKAKPPKESK